jgi:hypothetical protein
MAQEVLLASRPRGYSAGSTYQKPANEAVEPGCRQEVGPWTSQPNLSDNQTPFVRSAPPRSPTRRSRRSPRAPNEQDLPYARISSKTGDPR